jgi:Arc/MetJ-type ribon-helix-helix transcriptional regulator
MITLTITVPDSMGAFIEGQAASGGFGDASSYVQFLIRREQEQAVAGAAPAAVSDGKAQEEQGGSDPGAPVPPEAGSWQQTQSELLRRFRQTGGR